MDSDYNIQNINKMCSLYNMDKNISWKKDNNTGLFIYENFHNMNEIEKKRICSKIISPFDLDRILLQYELDTLCFPEKITDTLKLISIMNDLLKRYHHKVGGYQFEDNVWRLYTPTSKQKKYDLMPNEYIFDNSINIYNVEDAECHKFVDLLVGLFNRLSDNHKIHYKYIEDKYEDIYWVVIKISASN